METPVTFQTLKEHHTWKVLGAEYRLGASIAVGLGLNTDAALRRMDVCNWDHPLVVEVQRAGVGRW